MSARKKVNRKPAPKPVSEGIRRAAKRAGIASAKRAHAAADGLKDAIGELKELRKLATTALRIFEAEGIAGELTAAEILGEALRCNRDELCLFGDAIVGAGSRLDTMHLQRAKDRIDLALALATYREDYGPIKSPWGADETSETQGGAS